MQCKRALGLKVSSALVLHTGNVERFLAGLPLLVGDQPLPLGTPTLLGRTPTRHHELLSTNSARPREQKDLGIRHFGRDFFFYLYTIPFASAFKMVRRSASPGKAICAATEEALFARCSGARRASGQRLCERMVGQRQLAAAGNHDVHVVGSHQFLDPRQG